MSDTPANTVEQSKTSHWCKFTKTWPYPETCITCGEEAPVLYDSDTSSSGDDPFIGKASKVEKVYAAVRSTPFIVKASKEEKVVKPKKPKKIAKVSKERKVVKSKKPKKTTKKAVEIDDFYGMLFKTFPLSLPASPPFSDGQIDEFQCQHCGIHKELDDETWYACPYAIFHGLMKSGGDQRGNQSPVFSSSPNPKPKKFKEKPNKKETE